MKYEKTADTQLQHGARYQAAFNDAHAVDEAVFFLKKNSKGRWTRQGSSLFFHELDDAFRVRLYHGDGIKTLREAGGYTLPAPKEHT